MCSFAVWGRGSFCYIYYLKIVHLLPRPQTDPSDMGTYNYANPNDTMGHFIKDVKPYGAVWIKWGNVPEHASAVYK